MLPVGSGYPSGTRVPPRGATNQKGKKGVGGGGGSVREINSRGSKVEGADWEQILEEERRGGGRDFTLPVFVR